MSSVAFGFNIGLFKCLALRDMDEFDVNVLFVDTGRQRVLVDAGCGCTMAPPGQLLERLHAAGVAATDIDVVILTHADGDHIGGVGDAGGKSAFPKARYVLSREEWAYWDAAPV